jgi:serine/threonine protein kinase
VSGTPEKIGSYSITREIGRGGMGVVYLAHDTNLDRDVAVKALPEHLAQDPDRLARFEREAKTLASLNHPNLAGILAIEKTDDAQYLILEYVEGDTLADRLDAGPLHTDDAIDIAVQIANGIEAAHEAGVIHRDLKPANIKITPNGDVKVLDFGLARIDEGGSSSSSVSQLPTLTSPALNSPTQPGVILGTAAYMSPEQARGRTVDKRTDIWSFGVVLYEMLTGIGPFVGDTVSDSIGAILHKQINLDALPPNTSPALMHTLLRCLERDRRNRYRDIGDVRIELELSTRDTPELAASAPSRNLVPLITIAALAAVVTVSALALVVIASRGTDNEPGVVYSSIDPPPGTKLIALGDVSGPAVISPDGQSIVFVARDEDGEQLLWMRNLSEKDPAALRGTEGATFPFWSPDGRSVGFFVEGLMRRHDLGTRSTRTICDAPGGRGGAWLENGAILFAPSFQTAIFSVPAEGGEPTQITTIDTTRHTTHRWPCAIPATSKFIYTAVNHDPAKEDDAALYMANIDGSGNTEILATASSARVVDDHILFLLEDSLCAVRFNTTTGELLSDPARLIDGVPGDLTTWHSGIDVSRNNTLIYHTRSRSESDQAVGAVAGIGEATETLAVLRDGRPIQTLAESVQQNSLRISHSGIYVAISGRPANSRSDFDIWVYQGLDENSSFDSPTTMVPASARAINNSRQITFMPGAEVGPIWSPDDTQIVFGRFSGEGELGIWVTPISGGNPRLLLDSYNDEQIFPFDWTDDGRFIIFGTGSFIGTGIMKLYALPLDGSELIPLVTSEHDNREASVSPDGKWLALTSNESGRIEIYVVPFMPGWDDERASGDPVPDPEARWRISLAGGDLARWGKGINELYYVSSSNSLIAVDWETTGNTFTFDAGKPLFDMPLESGIDYDSQRNGLSFVLNTRSSVTGSPLHLVQNWQQLLDD